MWWRRRRDGGSFCTVMVPATRTTIQVLHRWMYLVTVVLGVSMVQRVNADWWELGLPSSISNSVELTPVAYKERCDNLEYLADKQKKMCALSDKILPILGQAAKFAMDECQAQFKNSRWNCSTFPENPSIFGNIGIVRSRETAYLSAISAASVAFAVTRACSKGELTECSCDNIKQRSKKQRPWQWGGCSDDIKYGMRFSREFMDAREDNNTALGLMNLHNNEAGRRSVRSKMQRICKCHGMSGSCSLKVCWRRLPAMKQVAEVLLQSYEGASHVKVVKRGRKRFRAYSHDMKQPEKLDLVYLDDSPDYCERNDTLSILGTKGRLCNRTSRGIDGCSLLCCGRGYQTRVREVEEKCQCEFVWCCRVQCELCRYKKEEHICN